MIEHNYNYNHDTTGDIPHKNWLLMTADAQTEEKEKKRCQVSR